MNLGDYPCFPYPRDPLIRFGFLLGDILTWSIILAIGYITLQATLRF